jgi:hypothetical protein
VSGNVCGVDSEDAESNETFLCRYVIPEEDCRRSTTTPYIFCGGGRRQRG